MISSLKKSKTGMVGVAIVLLVVLMAAASGILTPYDPAKQDLYHKLAGPIWSGGTGEHLLGTDQLGRDILSRIMYGSRVTLLVGFSGTVCAGLLGVSLGAIAGYFGKWADVVIMRIVDIQLSFPFILLALFIAAVLGRSLANVILIAAISNWVNYARLVRGEILAVKEMEYIEAIRSVGAKDGRIVLFHVIPNVISPVIVQATLGMARIITMEASLSFLGLGVPVEIATWGRMLAEGRDYMLTDPWLAIIPGLAITLTVLGVNLMGDWLRDYLDPKLDV